MKKSFFVAFSFMYILGNNIVLDGMITKKARQVSSKAVRSQPKVYQTKTSQKPLILFDRLKLYYNQAKQRISQFWYGKKYPQMVLDESNQILNDIHNKKNMSKTLESFDMFLEKKDQNSVNKLLNTLVFSNHEIDFLDTKVMPLFLGSSLNNRNSIKIARKIIQWAQENITQIFQQNIPITDDFFLISLLYIDYSLNKQLIPVIHDNLEDIKKQPMGQQFLTLIKSKNPTIYNAIIERKQTLKGILQEGAQKSLNELRVKE